MPKSSRLDLDVGKDVIIRMSWTTRIGSFAMTGRLGWHFKGLSYSVYSPSAEVLFQDDDITSVNEREGMIEITLKA